MSEKKKNPINEFIWYCSGLNVRALSGLSNQRAQYFGLGGMNLFSSFLTWFLTSIAVYIAFSKISIVGAILIGAVFSFLSFIINRQTINTISNSTYNGAKSSKKLVLVPIILFGLFISILVSTPIKLFLFNIQSESTLLIRLSELNEILDTNISSKITSWSITIIVLLIMLAPALTAYVTLNKTKVKNRSTLLNEFMWFCAGANKEILRRCPNDYSKYFGIGGTILFTAMMATLSGGYAFFTAFDNPTMAIFFGLFWGALIFNLDRFIVNTMYSDGKHTISWLEILGGLPRMIIAIFLGVVISYPLELKLFEDEINLSIETLKNKSLLERNNDMSEIYDGSINSSSAEITDARNQQGDLKLEKQSAYDEWKEIKKIPKQKSYFDTTVNKRVYYTVYVWPPEYEEKKDIYDQISAQNDSSIASLDIDIARSQNDIANKKSEKSGRETEYAAKVEALNDLSTRMEAFAFLKEEKPAVDNASLLIMILLVLIEIAPVLFKVMMASGDYDVILHEEKERIRVTEMVKSSKHNDWANTEIMKVVDENKKKVDEKRNELNAELAANDELLKAISTAQAEIAKIAIEKWKKEEIKKAKINPGSIIQSNSINNPIP